MFSQFALSILLIINPLACILTSNALVIKSTQYTDAGSGTKPERSDLGRRQVKDVDPSGLFARLDINSTSSKYSTHDLEFLSSFTQKYDVAKNLSRHESDKSESTLETQKFTPDQLDIIHKIQSELTASDVKCALHNENSKKAEPRSLQLEKRILPSDFLFTEPAQCLVVDMGKSDYLPWTGRDKSVIGTHGLCGCIGVGILGNGGAVISHLVALEDMEDQLNGMFAKFVSNMGGQYGIKAYVFTPEMGGSIDSYMAAAARLVATRVENFILQKMRISVFTTEYAVGDDSMDYARLGTLVATTEQGAIKLWINDLLANN